MYLGNFGDVYMGSWVEPISGKKLPVALKKLKDFQHANEFEKEASALLFEFSLKVISLALSERSLAIART